MSKLDTCRWELTEEQLRNACESYRPDIVNFAEPRAVAKVAQIELMKFINGSGLHSYAMPGNKLAFCISQKFWDDLYTKIVGGVRCKADTS